MLRHSALIHSRSLTRLEGNHSYDVKVGYDRKKTSRKSPQMRMITIYRNGDRFYSGTKVQSDKYFKRLGNLLDYLSQKLQIPQGVRYLFNLDGELVEHIDEIQNGASYVASGVKIYQDLDYGSLEKIRTSVVASKIKSGPLRPDDILLFRPLSPEITASNSLKTPVEHMKLRSGISSLPGPRESCVVTVINNYDHAVKSRVLLNLKTSQSFEDVLDDMGHAIKLRGVTRMLTPWGEEVRGFSHLRNDLYEVETFYLDYGDLDTSNCNRQPGPNRDVKMRKGTRKIQFERSISASKLDGFAKFPDKRQVLPFLRGRTLDDVNQNYRNFHS